MIFLRTTAFYNASFERYNIYTFSFSLIPALTVITTAIPNTTAKITIPVMAVIMYRKPESAPPKRSIIAVSKDKTDTIAQVNTTTFDADMTGLPDFLYLIRFMTAVMK